MLVGFFGLITLGQGGLAVLGVHLIGVHPLLYGEIKHSLITACGFHECTRRGFKILGDDWVDAFGPFIFGIGIDQGGELLLGFGQLGGDEGAHGVSGGVGVHFPRAKDGVVFAFATEEPLPGFATSAFRRIRFLASTLIFRAFCISSMARSNWPRLRSIRNSALVNISVQYMYVLAFLGTLFHVRIPLSDETVHGPSPTYPFF